MPMRASAPAHAPKRYTTCRCTAHPGDAVSCGLCAAPYLLSLQVRVFPRVPTGTVSGAAFCTVPLSFPVAAIVMDLTDLLTLLMFAASMLLSLYIIGIFMAQARAPRLEGQEVEQDLLRETMDASFSWSAEMPDDLPVREALPPRRPVVQRDPSAVETVPVHMLDARGRRTTIHCKLWMN